MENKNVKKFNINTVKEFKEIPKNEKIIINDCTCEILTNDNIYFGVKFYYEDSRCNGVEDMERALSMLRIRRECVYIKSIEKAKDLINDLTGDKEYRLVISSKDCSFDIVVSLYRTFSKYGYLNEITISPLVCNIEMNKLEVYDKDEDNTYNENRSIYFDIYGNNMLAFNHIYYPELDKEDDEIIDKIFQDIANVFNRKYVFHEYGIPSKIIEPEKKK